MFLALMSTHNCFNCLKYTRLSSGLATYGALVIRPLTRIPLNVLISLTKSSTSSGLRPNLFSSPATFTSTRISTTRFFLTASSLMAFASRTDSTECIIAALPTTYFTLFLCKCPIICHTISSGSVSTLSTIS